MAPVASSGPALLAGTNLDGSAVSWFDAHWMFFSWAFALVGLGILVARFPLRDPLWAGWLAPVMYGFHQSEEHAFDFRGWRYSFVPYMNEGFGKILFGAACGPDGAHNCPLDPAMTTWINVMLIWVGFGGCMAFATAYPERFLFAGMLNWGVAVINGLGGHLLQVVLTQSYNPGCVQSALMVPLGLYIIVGSQRPVLCLGVGVLVHVIGFGVGINLVLRAGLPEVPTVIAMSAAVGLGLPLAVSNLVRHPTAGYRSYLKPALL